MKNAFGSFFTNFRRFFINGRDRNAIIFATGNHNY